MRNKILTAIAIAALAVSTAACGSHSGTTAGTETSAAAPAETTQTEQKKEAGAGTAETAEQKEDDKVEEMQMEKQQEDLTLAKRVSESEDHYIFELREDVVREKVYDRTRYGIEIAALLDVGVLRVELVVLRALRG